MAPFPVSGVCVINGVPMVSVSPAGLESNCADPRVTVAPFDVAEMIFGWKVKDPPAGIWMVSGLRSHSAAGDEFGAPVMTKRVAEYGGNVCVLLQAWEEDVMIEVGEACDSAYDVTVPAVNPFSVNVTCAAFAGSLLTAMMVSGPLPV